MKDLFSGLLPMLCVYAAFSLMYIANIVFGIVTNCIDKGAAWDGKRFVRSLLRILLTGATMVVILVTFNLIGQGLASFGAEVNDTIVSVISVGTFVLLFAKGFAQTAIDVYAKIKAMFEIRDSKTFDTEAIASMDWQRPAEEINADHVTHEISGVG